MDYLVRVKERYPYMKDSDVKRTVEYAKSLYYNHRFPTDVSIDETNYEIPQRHKTLILQICDELVERAGISSAVGYAENGINISFDNAHISRELLNQIPPVVSGV